MKKLLLISTATAMATIGSAKADPVGLSAYVDANGFIDVQALTCAELANTYQGDANDLMSWYSGRTGSTIYDGAPIGTAAGLSALLTGKAAPPLNECGSE